jgi:integrase
MPSSTVLKRARHVPTGTTHVYYSERADGSKVYEVRYTTSTGVRKYEAVGSGKGAFAAAKQRARVLHDTRSPRIETTNTTLAQIVTSWRERKAPRMKPLSVESYEHIIRARIVPSPLYRMRVHDIRPRHITAWLDGMKRKDGGELAGSTKGVAYHVLKAMLREAVKMDALAAVPKLDKDDTPKPSPARERILTQDEEARLFATFDTRPWMVQIVNVCLGEALRLGEVCALRWEDVDWDGGRITVARNVDRNLRQGTPKGGKPATILLTDRARRTLAEMHLAVGRPAEGWIFTNSYGEPRNVRDVQRAIKEAAQRAGLEGVSMHCLRHTGISRYANAAGMDIARAVAFARHADAKVTLSYMHVVEDEAADEAGRAAI